MTDTKTNLLIGASMLAAVLCVGCEAGIEAEEPVDAAGFKKMSGYMQEVTLKDGTRCVTWKDFHAGGLSCDWKHESTR